jgi:outer membrane cobalamin receptor
MTPFGQGDVAGIEVIKPPAAEEIFGSEARGGIVRINTRARAIPPSVAGCKPPTNPYFEYQVSRPAIYLTNDVKFPQPVSASASNTARGTGLIVQVVVDTSGFPDARSFKILHAPNAAASAAVRHAFLGWRFIPASFQGCKVPQLVQTEVTP